MIDLYVKVREALRAKGHYAMPAECIMAARDALADGDSLDECLARRGLTNTQNHYKGRPDHYDKAALVEATEAVRSTMQ